MPASEETRKRVVQTLYWKEMRALLKDCGGIVDENGLDIHKLAEAAGIHPRTARNLFNGTTVFPQYRTVWCSVAALGFRVVHASRPRVPVKEIQRSARVGKKKRKKKTRGGKRRKS